MTKVDTRLRKTSIPHVVRPIAAPIAWFAGVAFVIGLAPPMWTGSPGSYSDDGCGTLFGDYWRDEPSGCHDRMISWLGWEAVFAAIAVVASIAWIVAHRHDRCRPPWKL